MALNLSFFTFYYPPLIAPRSVQISRMVKYSRHRIQVVSAAGGKACDKSIEGAWGDKPARLYSVPWAKYAWVMPWNVLRTPPVPDHYRQWAMSAARQSIAADLYANQQVLVTFGQPMSDHLAGLAIKRATGLPWITHFSDPWADSPYRSSWPLLSALNRCQEKKVIATADRILFTSPETLDLAMAKYPAAWRRKAQVLPHAYDSTLYGEAGARESRLLLRHLGHLRKPRTPDALLQALVRIKDARPDILARIRIELIGRVESDMDIERLKAELPAGSLELVRPVDYATSLRMMTEADLLLVLDAPFDSSVFLPSKLIDYIGAGRPIFAVSPAGTSTNLVTDLGGWVVPPGDPAAIAGRLVCAVESLSAAADRDKPWGAPGVRATFDAAQVIGRFDEIVEDLVQKS